MTERQWVVERTWLVTARTATEALEKAEPGQHRHIRVYEGSEPRPWPDDVDSDEEDDDGIDWAEVARRDRELRGECWYKVDAEGAVIDWWCEVHQRYERPQRSG